LREKTSSGAQAYTGAYFDLQEISYPAFYNLSFRPIQLFETGSIIRGWTFRQGDAGAYNISVDVSDAAGTTVTMRSWDAAGNTVTVATGHAPGIARPAYWQSSLVIVDCGFGNTATVYWQTHSASAGINTATAHMFDVLIDLWDGHSRFGPYEASTSGIYVSDYATVIERYATSTVTPTMTATATVTPTVTITPTTNMTPETGTSRRIFRYDDKERKFYQDNKERKFLYDDRPRTIYKSH